MGSRKGGIRLFILPDFLGWAGGNYVRLSQIAKLTGLSPRYWQKRVASEEVPGVKTLRCGNGKLYLVDVATFYLWWNAQLDPVPTCPKTSSAAAKSGGSAKGSRGRTKNSRST